MTIVTTQKCDVLRFLYMVSGSSRGDIWCCSVTDQFTIPKRRKDKTKQKNCFPGFFTKRLTTGNNGFRKQDGWSVVISEAYIYLL